MEDGQKLNKSYIKLLIKMKVVLTLIWCLNRLKSILMASIGLWRPLQAWKKGLKNDAITSFSYSFYDFENPRTDASKRTGFYG